MTTKYPYQIDNSVSLPDLIDNSTPVSASTVNDIKNAIISIQKELGVHPAGISGSVKNRFVSLEGAISSLTIGTGNFAPGGDLSGTESNQKVIGIQNIPVSDNSPISGQALVFDGTFWAPGNVSGGGSGGGDFTAGGDLTGTSTTQSVIKVHGVSYPSGGSLILGNIAIVSGVNTVSYAALNLANSNSVSGILGTANLPNATGTTNGVIRLTTDIGGTATAPNVIGLRGIALSNIAPTTNQFLQYDGTSWTPTTFSYSAPDATLSSKGILQIAGDISGTASSIIVSKLQGTSLSNVAPSNNQVLQYNGADWAPNTLTPYSPTDASTSVKGVIQLAGDIGGTSTNLSILKLRGTTLSATAPTLNQILQFDGTSWTPSTLSITPSDASISSKGIVQLSRDLGGTAALPNVIGLQGRDVSNTAPSTNQVLQWNGTSWAPGTVSAGGSTPDATSTVKGIILLANDLSGTAAAPVVAKINGTSVSSSAAIDQVLVATGSNAAGFGALNLAGVGVSGILPAANMTNASTSVLGTVKLAQDLGGTASLPKVIGLQGVSVSNTAPITNQILQYNGTNWAPSTIATYSPSDATTLAKGIVQLSGDLGGTAASPSTLKINGTSVSGTPAIGNVLTATSTSAATWQTPTTFTAGGDLTGSNTSQTVTKVNGATIPAAGTLTIGNSTYVSGTSALTYSALNLAGGSGWITGLLPAANQAAQTLLGDVAGTTAANVVAKINGTTVTTAGGALTTGNSLRVTGIGTADWGPINLALSAGVTGVLPSANQASQTMAGDVTGTTATSVVTKINGISASATASAGQVLTATSTTAATWQTPVTYTPIDATTSVKGIIQLAKDLGGTAALPNVIGLQGRPLTSTLPLDGQAIIYDGAGTTWKPATINLASSNAVGGILSSANQAAQTMAGDVTGTTAASSVVAIRGIAVDVAGPSPGQSLIATGTGTTAAWGAVNLASTASVTGTLGPGSLPLSTTSLRGAIVMTGDLGGSGSAPTVLKINGTSVSATAPTTDQYLWYNGANWTPNTIPAATTSGTGLIQLAGDLAGTATNPTLAVTTVTAGTYFNSDIIVDTKGRITAAAQSTNRRIRARSSVSGTISVSSTPYQNVALSGNIIVANGETLVCMGKLVNANTTGSATPTQYYNTQCGIYDIAGAAFTTGTGIEFSYVTPTARNANAMCTWTNVSGSSKTMQVAYQAGKSGGTEPTTNMTATVHYWIETIV